MAEHGPAGRGMAGQGRARQGVAWQGPASPGKARLGSAGQGEASQVTEQIYRTILWLKTAALGEGLLRFELGIEAPGPGELAEWCDYHAYVMARYTHGHLRRGDFGLLTFANGQGKRHPVYTVTSSNRILRRCYVSLAQLLFSPDKPTVTPACPGWNAEALRAAAGLNRTLAIAD